jgi:hypothetical protein
LAFPSFYCEGLGFSPSSASNDHILFLDAGGVVLALYPRDRLAKDAQLSPKGSGFPVSAAASSMSNSLRP